MLLLPAASQHEGSSCECKNAICGKNKLEKGISGRKKMTHYDTQWCEQETWSTVVFDHTVVWYALKNVKNVIIHSCVLVRCSCWNVSSILSVPLGLANQSQRAVSVMKIHFSKYKNITVTPSPKSLE